ncbi:MULTISPECIES: MMPL family transporter [Streptomyces]|uniref:MMPL family transporter n=1 Tax=Streptomyces mirabilis TaxID=68239 RepID=A0ABU3UHA8_9ACTN|nr:MULTISPECIES: MMPL family transporter [Streptomyces]MCX4613031.1 MMPL family transporter [Streptomyces mirabilis]MCX5353162.1 MMPL family transporter [Streptomyces mirabilis]MDU8993263.1 MMPL family transporter [Streptomyces mirabilis]QDN91192.1 MMPL family transporter [Streptomyces sp. RLB3-6]QDO12017.1 MMPL family transporter [Streptomyces sp. S1D4-23]
MFEGFGRLLYRRRKPVLLLTMLFAVLSGAYGAGVFGSLTPLGFQDPGSDSVRAARIAEKAFPQRTPDAVIVYRDKDRTVDDPSFQQAVVGQLESLPKSEVTGYLDFWRTKMPAQVSHDRHATYVALSLHGSSEKAKEDAYKAVKDKIPAPGLQTLQGGTVPTGHQASEKIEHDLRTAEIISAPVLFLLLLVVFGGLTAAFLPLLVGVLSILGSMAVLRTIANITDVSVFSMSLVTILGLAVAIDYGLLIVSRYREELAAGYTGEEAIGRTLATAGRTVMVSGTTVAAALAGLTLFPSTFLKSMSYGGVAAVLLAVLFSLVALPALLAVMGPKVNAFPLRRRKKAVHAAGAGEGSWYRFGHGLMRRRWVVVVGAVGLLVTLALPFSKIEFGSINAQQLPSTSEGRQVFNAMEHDFDGDAVKSIDSLLVLKSDGTSKDQGAALKAYAERLGATKDATSARITGVEGTTARVSVTFDGNAISTHARDLVNRLKDVPEPPGARAYFGGESAVYDDTLDALGETLPWMLLYIAVMTYLLLFLAFGSVLLPLKAIAMNMLSLSATFGVLVWIFQDGHLHNLLGFDPTGNIEPNMPIMLFALIFGLSMDYEVFLVSRMREQYDKQGDSTEAVAMGLRSIGRLVVSAAVLMCVPLAAIGMSDVLTIKLFGVGMVFAVLVDVLVVRILLGTAVMRLLGRAAWWAPGPLARFYERFGVKETDVPEDTDERVPVPTG